jgi:energy-coupling factor transporter ATP-binding protein EcfA2
MGKFAMNLRDSKFDDHWRHVFLRTYPTRFTAATLTNLKVPADSTVNFSAGINAIVGGNGVGKSTVVAAITELLAADPNSIESGYRSKLQGSTISGTAFCTGTEVHLGVQDDGSGGRIANGGKFEGHFRWLDPSDLANRSIHQIHADQNFDDLLEPLTPLQLSSEELKIASYLVGKEYDDIGIFEISEYGGYEVFPYFQVSSCGASYGSEGMGRGELSLLLTYWTLRDIPSNAILILEEPETHVSPSSQDSLMNIVAKFSDERAIWVIVTTHSPTIARRIPREHLKLLIRGLGAALCAPNANKLDVALLLGGGAAYQGVILVEDQKARQFTLALLEKLEPEMLRQFEIIVAGSDSNITNLLRSMPTTRSWLTFIGIYDGDLRSSLIVQEHKWPHGFLPGDVAPEILLKSLADTTQTLADDIARELGTSVEQANLALNHAAGADHHEYFGKFAAALNLEVSIVIRGFVRIWLTQESNEEAARGFIEVVRKAVRGD